MNDNANRAEIPNLADRFAPQTGELGQGEPHADLPGLMTAARDHLEIGIEFAWLDGRLMTVEYGHLVYTSLEADGTAVIQFSRLRFSLAGRNLAPLLRRAKDHRLGRIAEVLEVHDAVLPEESAVYRITVEIE
jgi:hypothetical protein